MRADARDGGIPGLQLLLIGGFDFALPGSHHLVQLLDGGIPPCAIKTRKGLVVAIELTDRLPAKPSQVSLVPINEVRSQLPDRMIALLVCPASLFRR